MERDLLCHFILAIAIRAAYPVKKGSGEGSSVQRRTWLIFTFIWQLLSHRTCNHYTQTHIQTQIRRAWTFTAPSFVVRIVMARKKTRQYFIQAHGATLRKMVILGKWWIAEYPKQPSQLQLICLYILTKQFKRVKYLHEFLQNPCLRNCLVYSNRELVFALHLCFDLRQEDRKKGKILGSFRPVQLLTQNCHWLKWEFAWKCILR